MENVLKTGFYLLEWHKVIVRGQVRITAPQWINYPIVNRLLSFNNG
jgi:hypothetical protein